MNSQQNLWRLVLLLTLVSAVGCRPATPVATAPPEETTPGTSDGVPRVESTINKRLAIQAKDALAERLTARLTDAMTTAGPAAAVQVCSEVAQQLANEVGTEFRVRIGRTSFKLRNPKNVPPAWAAELVEQRVDSPQFRALEDGTSAALLPIKLQPQCLVCHGASESISAEIREALSVHYPDDYATGFEVGELRGWFWVEVPQAR